MDFSVYSSFYFSNGYTPIKNKKKGRKKMNTHVTIAKK